MAKVNYSSSGCRAVVLAGKYFSSPAGPALARGGPGQRQHRGMLGRQRRGLSSEAAGAGGKNAPAAQQEPLGCLSASDRHMLSNRSLIYRDVRAFLSEVGGDPREARYWLTQFQRATATQSPAFAVLEVRLRSSEFLRRKRRVEIKWPRCPFLKQHRKAVTCHGVSIQLTLGQLGKVQFLHILYAVLRIWSTMHLNPPTPTR